MTAAGTKELAQGAAVDASLPAAETDDVVGASAPATEQPVSTPLEDASGKVPATSQGAAGAAQETTLLGEEGDGASKADDDEDGAAGREAERPAPASNEGASEVTDLLPSAAKPDGVTAAPTVVAAAAAAAAAAAVALEESSPLAEEAVVEERAPPVAGAAVEIEENFVPSTPELDELLPPAAAAREEVAETPVRHTGEDAHAVATTGIEAATPEVEGEAAELEEAELGAAVTQESTAIGDELEVRLEKPAQC